MTSEAKRPVALEPCKFCAAGVFFCSVLTGSKVAEAKGDTGLAMLRHIDQAHTELIGIDPEERIRLSVRALMEERLWQQRN